MNKKNNLPVLIKGMVFAVVLMFSLTSCCITGYCQIDAAETQQKNQSNKQ